MDSLYSTRTLGWVPFFQAAVTSKQTQQSLVGSSQKLVWFCLSCFAFIKKNVVFYV